jgi:hypothetical protein
MNPMRPRFSPLAALFPGLGMDPFPVLPPPKEEKKCLLPQCPNLTRHNGGYCSADHKRLDDERRNNAKKH